MGFSLKLLPIEYEDMTFGWSHSVLSCDLNSSTVLDMRDSLRPHMVAITTEFNSYVSRDGECEETHYGVTATDNAFSEPLCWVEVEHLLEWSSHEEIAGSGWGRNRAIWAYLAQLPPRSRIALYWD